MSNQPAPKPQPKPAVSVSQETGAITNFFWTFDVQGQVFNLQTTLSGTLTKPELDAHVSTLLDAMSIIINTGGHAKQVGGSTPASPQQASELPVTVIVPPSVPDVVPGLESQPQPQAEYQQISDGSFKTAKLLVELKEHEGAAKKYFKITSAGGKFAKFGVRVWDEVLADARTTWDSLRQALLQREARLPSASRVMSELAQRLPADTIVAVGAGVHLLYAMAFMPCNHPLTYLSTVNFGAMGFGLAGAMAARKVYPGRSVLAVLGDGDFMMTVQDLETAVREQMNIKVVVVNDFQYRVLNWRQRIQYGGRVLGTEHGNPDFAELARSFGARGYRLDVWSCTFY